MRALVPTRGLAVQEFEIVRALGPFLPQLVGTGADLFRGLRLHAGEAADVRPVRVLFTDLLRTVLIFHTLSCGVQLVCARTELNWSG